MGKGAHRFVVDPKGGQNPGASGNTLPFADAQKLQLTALRRRRAAAFRAEVVPYFRYVLQSGFGLLVAVIFFAALIGYSNLLQDMPHDFPADLAGVAAIACAALWTPLRTYVQPADTVFLLSLETQVERFYIRQALNRAAFRNAFLTLMVYVVFVPVYMRAPVTLEAAHSRPLWLVGLLLVAVAVWNVSGNWHERRLSGARRYLSKVVRAAITLSAVWVLLNNAFWPAAAWVTGLLLLVRIGWHYARNTGFPWELLMKEEAVANRRWQRFLGWFVDVPSAEAKSVRRRWASWIGDRLPWSKTHAWHYWYVKAFIRGETFGPWMRWHLVIAFIMLVVDHRVADGIIYLTGLFVGGMQLTELARLRMGPSVHVLPLGQDDCQMAAMSVARSAGVLGAALLWLVGALPNGTGVALSWQALGLLLAGMMWSGWLAPRRLGKSFATDED
jgi:ABC-2 type transport system permease protein